MDGETEGWRDGWKDGWRTHPSPSSVGCWRKSIPPTHQPINPPTHQPVNPPAQEKDPPSKEPQGISTSGDFWGQPLLLGPIPAPPTPKHPRPPTHRWPLIPGTSSGGDLSGCSHQHPWAHIPRPHIWEKDLAEQVEEEEKAGNTFCSTGHRSGPTSADCKAAAEKEYINIYIHTIIGSFTEQTDSRHINIR